MARKRSTRKRPEREDFMLKEAKKVESMLDRKTMVYLSKFYNKGIVSGMGPLIARGKEADVYVASAGDSKEISGKEYVILKFFRIETSTFFNMEEYITGDPRFAKLSKSKVDIVETWCRKEFGNLLLASEGGVRVPKPYMFNGNILAMEYVDDGNGHQARQLKDARLDWDEAETVLERILGEVRKLYRVKLVHGDLSEYNILLSEGKPCLIDMGQGVVLKHPNAMAFLARDIDNLLTYFRKAYGIERDAGKTLAWVME